LEYFLVKINQPSVIAGVLIVVAISIAWINNASRSSISGNTQSETAGNVGTEGNANSFQLKPASTGNAGQEVPRIVQNMNSSQVNQEGAVNAPDLGRLVKGLEDKVAADPSNVNNKLLLAQTYNELGMQNKAIKTMRAIQKEQPNDGRTNLIFVSILSRSNDQKNLKESLSIMDKLSKDKTIKQYLVNLYRGDSLIRMQDHAGALKYWKLALKEMPSEDNRRAIIEQRIANLGTTPSDKKVSNPKAAGGKS